MHRRAQPAAGELRPAPCNERINERRLTGSRVTRTYTRPMIGLTLDPARRRRDDERNPTGRFQPDDMLYLIVDKLLPLEVRTGIVGNVVFRAFTSGPDISDALSSTDQCFIGCFCRARLRYSTEFQSRLKTLEHLCCYNISAYNAYTS